MILKFNSRSSCRQNGSMLITSSIFFIVLIGIAVVAVDVGHLMIARNELQNAADAAALAGANCLSKTPTASGADCINSASPTLNWTVAKAKALSAVSLNESDGTPLTDAIVTTGYKNLQGAIGASGGLEPNPLGSDYKPAVMVSLSKMPGKNGGPVSLMITRMFNGAAVPITVNAIAVISGPSSITYKLAIPVVINQCMFDLYWDSVNETPKLATASTLNGVEQEIGKPWEVRIGSSYHYPNCDSGQWTSFGLNQDDVPTVRSLISNGNPVSLSIGDNTWVEPGTKNSLYGDLSSKYATPLSPPPSNTSTSLDVIMPVVNLPTGLANRGATPIAAFAGFHIDDVQGGSAKYIQGHFIKGVTATGSSGTGPYYGTYTPPRLAQ